MNRLTNILYFAPFLIGLCNWHSPLHASVDPLLPDMGSSERRILNPHDERDMGILFMREVRKSLTLSSDVSLVHYISQIGKRLLATTLSRKRTATFFIVEDNSINAFAGPDGHIGIHSGLILATHNESELAAVMAHEIAHVLQNHLARQLENQKNLNLPSMAAILGAIILSGNNPKLGNAALATTLAGSRQLSLNFSRQHEREADYIGLRILAEAGFNPQGMADFFSRLHQKTEWLHENTPELLRTHPVTLSRLAESRQQASQWPKTGYREAFQYHTMRSRLNAEQQNTRSSWPLSSLGTLSDTTLINTYQKALKQLNARRYPQALRMATQLLRKSPNRIPFILLAADIEQQQNAPQKAIQRLTSALELFPEHPVITAKLARLYLTTHQAKPATILLKYLIQQQPLNTENYRLMATAQGQLSRAENMHRYMAEYHFLSGHFTLAIEQLERALKETQVTSLQESLRARKEEMEDFLKADVIQRIKFR
jgi:beta-barrel assembly-enhancing protease